MYASAATRLSYRACSSPRRAFTTQRRAEARGRGTSGSENMPGARLGQAELTFRCARSDSGAPSKDTEYTLGASPPCPPIRGRNFSRSRGPPSTTSEPARGGNDENPCDHGPLRTFTNVRHRHCNAINPNNYSRISTAGNVLFILLYDRSNQIHNQALGPLGIFWQRRFVPLGNCGGGGRKPRLGDRSPE